MSGMSAEAERQMREIERLQEGMVVELDRRFSGLKERSIPPNSSRGRNEAGVDEEVASTISVIRHVSGVLGELQETIRRQEELIYEQRQAIADLQNQKQEAFGELAGAERTMKAERERADRAEAKVQSGEAQIRRLEEYSVSLKSHLNSLMAVVRDTLPTEEGGRRIEGRSA